MMARRDSGPSCGAVAQKIYESGSLPGSLQQYVDESLPLFRLYRQSIAMAELRPDIDTVDEFL